MKKITLCFLASLSLRPLVGSVAWTTPPPASVFSTQTYSVGASNTESNTTVVNVTIVKNGNQVANQGNGSGVSGTYTTSTVWSGSDTQSTGSTITWIASGYSTTSGTYAPDNTIQSTTLVSDPTPYITGVSTNPGAPIRPGTLFRPHVSAATPWGGLASIHIYKSAPPFTGYPNSTQYNAIDASAEAFVAASGPSFAVDGNSITAGPDGTVYPLYAAAETVYNGVSYYSAPYGPINVTVQGVNGSTFVSQSVPSAVYTSSAFGISQTWNNSGSTTWTSTSNYKVASQNPQDNTTWGVSRYTTTGTVAPGANATLSWTATAPGTHGAYNFQSEMVQDGIAWFGALSPNVVIQVASRPNALISATSPTISYLQSTTINASFATDSGDGDTLLGSNIDSPVGIGMGDGTPQNPRSYVFTPGAVGTYTFYARMYTTLTPSWQTYGQVTVTVNPASQSITSFPQIPTHTYGDADITLSATASSGLPVTFSVFSGPATMSSGTTLRINGVGTVVVYANQAGSGNYYAAPTAIQWFAVNAANQSVVSITSSPSSTWLSSYTATATGGSGTGAIVWSLGVGSTAPTPAINSSTGVVTTTGVGTVVINVYRAADATHTQSATASLTLTVNPMPTTYSVNNFTYNGSAQTVVITPNPAGATFTPGGTRTATGAGTYTATASASGNYTGTNNNLQWTIAKANQAAVSSANASVVYGNSWAPTYSGGSGTGNWQFSLAQISNFPTNGAAGTGFPDDSNIITSWVANTNAGSQITFGIRKHGDANYNDSATVGYTLTISGAGLKVFTPTP